MSNGDRKRRKWGCVVACKDADGRIVSWQARYQSPVNPRQRIYRRFGLEFQTEAYRWLDEEHALVIDHKKGNPQVDAPVCKDDARQGPVLLIRDAFRRQPAEEGRVGAERQKQADPEGGVGQTAPLVRRDAHVRHHRGIRQRMVREGMRRGASLRARARGLAAQAPDEGRDRAAAGRRSATIVLESMQSRHEEETVQKTRAGADDQAGDRHAGRGLPGILPPVDPSRAAGGRAAHRRGLRTAT